MTGIHTNVLVRYLTQDDPVQSPIATRFIEKNCTAESPGFIPVLVLVELVWVLQSHYGASRDEIIKVVTTLLQTRQLAVDAADLVWQAVRLYQSSDAGFADCLIERQCHAVGIGVVTFDKSAAKAGMALLLK
ncbi:MAG: PIN domain-containing protein [Burkholderiales bacterium]|jgi:predicted nucleic-acid-binding protein|nr:type II toxin-antitoxin system VapC family toxin [Betaproteobacteria bacterium]